MSAEEKLLKAMKSCERALENLHNGNKLLARGDINHLKSFAEAAYWLVDSQIKEEEDEY